MVDLYIKGQPGLQNKFKDSQGFTRKPSLKNKQYYNNNNNYNKILWSFSCPLKYKVKVKSLVKCVANPEQESNREGQETAQGEKALLILK